MKQSWSIIVLCYNESGTIKEVCDELFYLFDEHRPGLYEIIIVDDGSSDNSIQKIESIKKVRPDVVNTVLHEKNKGIGASLIDGYKAAKFENVCAVPADKQFDVRELIPQLNIEEHTFISFYRLENVQYTTFRNFLSYMNKKINKIFAGIDLKDVNWVNAYKTSAIKAFPWELKSSLIESELSGKLLKSGYKAVEVLSYYHPRISGKSKGVSPRVLFKAIFETAKLIWVIYKFKPTKNK